MRMLTYLFPVIMHSSDNITALTNVNAFTGTFIIHSINTGYLMFGWFQWINVNWIIQPSRFNGFPVMFFLLNPMHTMIVWWLQTLKSFGFMRFMSDDNNITIPIRIKNTMILLNRYEHWTQWFQCTILLTLPWFQPRESCELGLLGFGCIRPNPAASHFKQAIPDCRSVPLCAVITRVGRGAAPRPECSTRRSHPCHE